jgi:hypothetical protein
MESIAKEWWIGHDREIGQVWPIWNKDRKIHVVVQIGYGVTTVHRPS